MDVPVYARAGGKCGVAAREQQTREEGREDMVDKVVPEEA